MNFFSLTTSVIEVIFEQGDFQSALCRVFTVETKSLIMNMKNGKLFDKTFLLATWCLSNDTNV